MDDITAIGMDEAERKEVAMHVFYG
jgi:hypothetical protein